MPTPRYCYAYGLVNALPPADWQLPGVFDAPSQVMPCEGLHLLYASIDNPGRLWRLPRQQGNTLRQAKPWNPFAQHQMLQLMLHRQGFEVLPFRYGTVFESAEHAATFLGLHRQPLAQALRQASGTCEYHLTPDFGFGEEEAGEVPAGGAAFFRYRYRQHQRLKALEASFQALRARMAELAPSIRFRADDAGASSPFLVAWMPPASLPELRQACQAALDEFPGLSLKATGPWPPYSAMPALPVRAEQDGGPFATASFQQKHLQA
jgi:hypothetical protein